MRKREESKTISEQIKKRSSGRAASAKKSEKKTVKKTEKKTEKKADKAGTKKTAAKKNKAAKALEEKAAAVSKKLQRKQENREKNRPSLFTLEEAEKAKAEKLNNMKQPAKTAKASKKAAASKKSSRKTNEILPMTETAESMKPAVSAAESAAVIMAVQEDRRQRELSDLAKKKASAMIPDPSKKIKVIMLGGLEQIGMNITAFESENSIVVVDCGMAFPNEDMLGIDLVIPDISYLKERAQKIEGFFITHGHEDHIGALPYVLRELNVPVYATRLTRALIENKLREAELLDSAKLRTVEFGDFVGAGDFTVEFIKTNHSIQDAAALAIHSPAGVILHTGDFKVDYTPVFGDTIDLQRFAELGKNGVLALLCDSTNAVRQGNRSILR